MVRKPQALILPFAAAAVLTVGGILMTGDDPAAQADELEQSATGVDLTGLRLATFGSGCFWCTEAVFQQLQGVESVVSGYAGGDAETANYKAVSTGRTDHAEVIQVAYDPAVVDYKTLLEAFWKSHDPTTLNRQGADVGPQYRSVVFFHDAEQKKLAVEYKAKLDDSGAFAEPIVTEIAPYDAFYPAEKYHQDFFAQNQSHPYCRAVIGPKLAKFKAVFGEKLKGASAQPLRPKRQPDGPPRSQQQRSQQQQAGPQAAASAAPASMSDTVAASAVGGGNDQGNPQDRAAGGDRAASTRPGKLPVGTDWRLVDWKSRLTEEQFRVTRRAGTERAFQNRYWDNKRSGLYRCVCCDLPLFSSAAKYKSGTGWPSFFSPVSQDAVSEHEDRGFFTVRTEVRCSRCDAHLGHVFEDGPEPTGLRYCMNSAAMDFEAGAPDGAPGG